MKNRNLRWLIQGAMLAAIYIALTMAVAPIAFGSLQFRVSEALTLTAALTPAAIPGLTLGCLLSNLLGANLGWVDVIFGTLATFLASLLVYRLRHRVKVWLLPLPMILFNALIVGTYLPFLLLEPGATVTWDMVLISILSLGLCEAAVLYLLGMPLYFAAQKTGYFKEDR